MQGSDPHLQAGPVPHEARWSVLASIKAPRSSSKALLPVQRRSKSSLLALCLRSARTFPYHLPLFWEEVMSRPDIGATASIVGPVPDDPNIRGIS